MIGALLLSMGGLYAASHGLRLALAWRPPADAGRPPASVTVVARTCAEADAWATALMVLGPEAGARLAERLGLDALFMVRNDTGRIRTATAGRLFSKEPRAMIPAEGS